jgi:HD-GYP domain-containing protein (c-di-GMP phosphodiesterase class II)
VDKCHPQILINIAVIQFRNLAKSTLFPPPETESHMMKVNTALASQPVQPTWRLGATQAQYTGSHSIRVKSLAQAMLAEACLSWRESAAILVAARLHDIGKLAIPEAILSKPGPLTPDEKSVLDRHAEIGGNWLLRWTRQPALASMVRHHHERWDGDGYPNGLRGRDIPYGARLIAVADSFDAMTSDRPYHNSQSVAQATRALRAGRGRQWDPAMVDLLTRALDRRRPAPIASPAQYAFNWLPAA